MKTIILGIMLVLSMMLSLNAFAEDVDGKAATDLIINNLHTYIDGPCIVHVNTRGESGFIVSVMGADYGQMTISNYIGSKFTEISNKDGVIKIVFEDDNVADILSRQKISTIIMTAKSIEVSQQLGPVTHTESCVYQ